MKTKGLIAITIVAVSALLLGVFSAQDDGNGINEQTGETFVERALRTRTSVDMERTQPDNSDTTFLERAVNTRASELVERVDSKP